MIELHFLNGPRVGQRIRLSEAKISLGSKPSNSIPVYEPSVAPKHAILQRGMKGYSIIVHKSKPIVTVNGKQVVRMFLKHGDRIRLGNVDLEYLSPEDAHHHDFPAVTAMVPHFPVFTPETTPGSVDSPLSLDDDPSETVHRGKNWKGILVGMTLLSLMLGGSLWVFRKELWNVEPPSPEKSQAELDSGPLPKEPPPTDQPPTPPEPNVQLPQHIVGVGPSGLREKGKIYRSSQFKSHQEAVDAAHPGDSVVFDSRDDRAIEVKHKLEDIQFLSGSAKWELHADVIDCQFLFQEMPQFVQKAGRLESAVFYHCAMKYTHLIHADTVSIYFDERTPLHPKDNGNGGKRPILELTGFVQKVLIQKPFSGLTGADKRFDMAWEPAIRIEATDPLGDGRGTYILSPVVMGQRAWTPHQIARGSQVTYAHLTTDFASWADPVLDISHGNDCVVLATSIGAETPATPDLYTAVPKKLKYANHEEFGHDAPGPAYRGAVICIYGQRNRVVGCGAVRKPWSLGRKSTLPGLHYIDGIIAADPFLRQFATEHGGVGLNFAEHRGICLMNPSREGADFHSSPQDAQGVPFYPLDGPDLIAPTLLPLKDLRINAGGFDKLNLVDMSKKPVEEIEKVLQKDGSVFLAAGTYEFTRPLTAGLIVGAGMEKTILKWPGTVDCTQRSCRGIMNCTVWGGRFGYNSQAGAGAKTGNPIGQFLRTRFTDQKEGGINLHTSQFQTWQDCEFVNSKFGFSHGQDKTVGVYKGDRGAAGGVTIDSLSICNCTFRKLTNRGIDLAPDDPRLGHVAVHNCRFEEIGEAAISILGGQTHLVQQCSLMSCGKKTGSAAIQIDSASVAALSHLKIASSPAKNNGIGIAIKGLGVVSHCEMIGANVALKCDRVLAADHVVADGTVQALRDSLLCRCRFKNSSLPDGISLVTESGFGDVTAHASHPRLDMTPPPEVSDLKVRTIDRQRRLDWTPVIDPESGIAQYIIYSQGKEIGHTPFQYEPPGEAHGPLLKPIYPFVFFDANLAHNDYRVVAVNCAGLTSEGKPALARRWGPARAKFVDKDGNEIVITKFSEVKGKVTGIVNQEGTVIPLTQLGKASLPKTISFDPSEPIHP